MTKPWKSRTLWANALALVAMVVQQATGQDFLSPEVQVSALALINFALRLITKDPIGLH